jgi:hypothetical protein
MAIINPRLSLRNSLVNSPQIIGLNGRLVGEDNTPPPEEPISSLTTRPTFPTGGIMDRNIPLNTPDDGLMAMRSSKPLTPEMDTYKAYLRNVPSRADTKIGKIGGLLAGIAAGAEGWNRGAGAGLMVGRSIIDRPYQRKVEDYNTKGGNLKELADLEYRSLTDEDKKAYQQSELNLKIRKQIADEFKMNSDIGMNDARVAEIADRIQTGGLSLERNSSDGQLYVVDKKAKTKTPMGKFAETTEETRAGNYKYKAKEIGLEQANRIGLENIKYDHDVYLHNLDNKAKEKLEKLKDDLANKGGMNQTQQNAAFEGAFKETIAFNRDLADDIFDADGNYLPNAKKEDIRKFNDKLAQRINHRLGSKIEDEGSLAPLSQEEKVKGVPIVREWNKAHPDQLIDENNAALVREAIRLDAEQSGNATPASGTPQVTAPNTAAPTVTAPTNNNGPFLGQPNPILKNMNYDVPTADQPLMGNPYSLAGVYDRIRENFKSPQQSPIMSPETSQAPSPTPLMQANNPQAVPPQPSLGDVGRGIMNSDFMYSNPQNIQEFKDAMSKIGVVFPDLSSLRNAWANFVGNASENIGNSPLMGGPGTRQMVR